MKRTKPYYPTDPSDFQTPPKRGRIGPAIEVNRVVQDDMVEVQRLMDSFTQEEIYQLAWLFTLGQVRAAKRKRTLNRERQAQVSKTHYSDGTPRPTQKTKPDPNWNRNWYQELYRGSIRWEDITPEGQERTFYLYKGSKLIPDDYPPKAKWLNTWDGKQAMARIKEAEQRKQEEVNAIRAEAFMEWTEKLLSASLSLPDGTQVTWGTATAAQHEARIKMLHVNVVANAEAIARHEEALIRLAAYGVDTLNGVGA